MATFRPSRPSSRRAAASDCEIRRNRQLEYSIDGMLPARPGNVQTRCTYGPLPILAVVVDVLVDGEVKGVPRGGSVGKSSRKLVLCLQSPSEFGGDCKAVRSNEGQNCWPVHSTKVGNWLAPRVRVVWRGVCASGRSNLEPVISPLVSQLGGCFTSNNFTQISFAPTCHRRGKD